ncbi:MAG: FlgO family outer membrane protein [Desulfurivibrionaceae bacterium]|nr:FlgO family outer membrane protein [Desulfurivibrionaceae bacterium]
MKKSITKIFAVIWLVSLAGLGGSPLLAQENNGQVAIQINVPPTQMSQADPTMAILPESEAAPAPPDMRKEAPEEREQTALIPGAPYPETPQDGARLNKGAPSAYLDLTAQESRQQQGRGRYQVYHYMPEDSRSKGTEVLLSELSREVAGKVYYGLRDDGEKHYSAKVAIVGAVPLADLKRETEFGRLMAEYLLTDLADRGLKVTELRLGKEINILAQTGEFILSRNSNELANNNQELDYVVVSTYSNTRKTLVLQGRLVSLKDGIIKTSWRYTLPLNRELLSLFHSIEKPYTIAVKGTAN